jgi:hypothetical protein
MTDTPIPVATLRAILTMPEAPRRTLLALLPQSGEVPVRVTFALGCGNTLDTPMAPSP